jgi:hypothetical protein
MKYGQTAHTEAVELIVFGRDRFSQAGSCNFAADLLPASPLRPSFCQSPYAQPSLSASIPGVHFPILFFVRYEQCLWILLTAVPVQLHMPFAGNLLPRRTPAGVCCRHLLLNILFNL